MTERPHGVVAYADAVAALLPALQVPHPARIYGQSLACDDPKAVAAVRGHFGR